VGRKKKHSEEHENNERWLVSYADFITLLFAFFTTLYAISTVDAQKAGKLQYSVNEALGTAVFKSGSKTLSLSQSSGNGESAMATPHDLVQSIQQEKAAHGRGGSQILSGEKDLGKLKKDVAQRLAAEVIKGMIRMHIEPRGLIISLGEGGFFDSGCDQIKTEGKIILDQIAESLVSVGNQIRIEGHTDNVPIKNSKFPSNWELSTSRATVIVRYFIAQYGFQPEMLSSAGYAEYRPAWTNETEEGKSRNRRVDIVVLNPTASRVEPK
jgi:chemotaxis protein MotB